MNEGQEGQIIDSENYRSSESFGFREIVMRQLQRVVTNMSQEMRKGFWVTSQAINMTPTKIKYVGDSRKELKQSLDVLHDLLLPKFDDEMRKQSEQIYKECEELYEKYKKKEISSEDFTFWEKNLKNYRTLFQQLSLFLERLGWLESSGVEE